MAASVLEYGCGGGVEMEECHSGDVGVGTKTHCTFQE